ncbi:polysaccharide pyruvyl transferase family protein [Francisella philomiragia subsp. philomiragia ATCC 25015]|uniref:polysaccharide pyruvyl transferase family protein n=1 Tax=Francisella philomiragia TaxID=28110 RepID=UPI0001AF77B7|nr:polysaccharide pyruvyl transferase family protein [Francisella philomiragia]AJI75863.1 polysaccharide pyruvyl transferase family protein [Francisella philomiragia subsp. philomiragia ATCC 25015]EET20925.1 predicted protein [Francisella philomiragia subsp. philomiragia ATCC 25015]MBK2238185.1 polysaccharide pyruvyl transferase family protein [Francisella philomiragia]
MKKKKIGLVGYFGFGNFGDELFMDVHKQFLADDYELEVVHDLTEAPYFSQKALKNLDSFDGFVIGGGDLLNPNAVSTLYWREEFLKKPVFVHGIGCPNHKVKSSRALSYFNKFFSHENVKYICLRDIESKRYFDSVIKANVETVTHPDAVFALKIPAVKKNPKQKIMGVVLRGLAQGNLAGGDYPQVRKAADEARRLGYKIRVIVGAFGPLGEGDLQKAKDFALSDEEVVYSEDLMEICKSIGECSMLLSMKFHALVVGAMYSIPVIQLSSTLKNRNLFRYMQRPDLVGNHGDEELYRKIPPVPAPLHSLLVKNLKRNAEIGYIELKKAMSSAL